MESFFKFSPGSVPGVYCLAASRRRACIFPRYFCREIIVHSYELSGFSEFSFIQFQSPTHQAGKALTMGDDNKHHSLFRL